MKTDTLAIAVRRGLGVGGATVLLSMSPMVLSDSTFGSVIELSELDGNDGFVINGIDAEDRSGFSVSNAGDINDDGVDDLIIGAPYADPNSTFGAGESYVVFGRSGLGSNGSIELSDLDGNNGFVLNGNNDVFEQSGFAVSGAGDVNGDGVSDLIIGARRSDSNDINTTGNSYVVFGGSDVGIGGTVELSDLDGSNGFVINGIDTDDQLGYAVSGAGDINGDGFDDLIVGARNADPNGINRAGESYVVFGGSSVNISGTVELSDLNGSNGFVINGIGTDDFSGFSVGGAGDVSGDGIDDLIIGAIGADPTGNGGFAGQSYVVFGNASAGSTGTIELTDLDGSNGFMINGALFDRIGQSVGGAGDINNDGVTDIIIGAPSAGSAGESYVMFGGSNAGVTGSFELSDLDGNNGFTIKGINQNDFSGRSDGAGDVNGDGVDDLIIGAYRADPNGTDYAGESYVVFGGNGVGVSGALELRDLDGSNGFVINGIDATDRSGRPVSGAGDVNGDGLADLIIGADQADPNGNSNAGESYVIFGKNVPQCNGRFVTVDLNFGESPRRGADVVLGTEGNDDIRGRAGNDTICGMGGSDFIHGNSGNDWIDGGDGVDNLRGGQGNDVLFTGSGATVGTSSIVFGGNGDDEINGGGDADDLRGGSGEDTINGHDGDDEISGNADADILMGGNGDDIVRGGQGDDQLNGDAGEDFLSGGGGALDVCDGGSGELDLATESCEVVTNVP